MQVRGYVMYAFLTCVRRCEMVGVISESSSGNADHNLVCSVYAPPPLSGPGEKGDE